MSANGGTSATGATSCSISATPTGSPWAQVAILAISLARPCRSSSPTYSISSAQASVSASRRPAGSAPQPRPPVPASGRRTAAPRRPLRTSWRERSPSSPRERRGRARSPGPAAVRYAGHGLHVGCLPSSRWRPIVLLPPPVHLGDDHQSRIAEEAARVAQRDRIGPGRLDCRDDLHGFRHEPAPQALHRSLTLGLSLPEIRYAGFSDGGSFTRPTVLHARPGSSASDRRTRARFSRSGPCDTPRGRRGTQHGQGVGPRVPIVVESSDRDHGDAGSEHPSFVCQPFVGGTRGGRP